MSWIDVDKWQEIFNSIRRHKLRTSLTAFGVAWGIFMLVLLMGSINGLMNSFEHDFRDDAVNSLWLYRGTTSKDFNGLNKGRNIQFDNSDYDFLKNQFPQIDEMSGRFYLNGDQIAKYGDLSFSYNVRSVHPGHQILENTEIINGRYINETDIDEFRKVAVIGKLVKSQLMPDVDDAIGKEISIGGIIYKVVGVFYDSGGEREMKNIYLPISTAQKIYSDGNKIHQLMISGGDLSLEEMQKMENDIRVSFAARKQFDASDKRALRINNRAENFQQFSSLFRAFKVITWIVGIFSIIAGVIGISNIMLIIVKDRTKEIGIRKALGATPRSIVSMILQESIFITAVAGYVGMVAGIAIIALVADAESDFFRHPRVDLGIIIMATVILVVAGGLAGLIPAIKAARINPVHAIKST